MGWFGRGRGGSGTGGGRHAVLPIPLTGAMLSGEIRDGAGRPVTGAAVTVLSPAGERAACERLWADVASLLKKARKGG